MASSQANIEKMHLRQSYRNVWHTDIMSTMQADFPCTLAAAAARPLHFFSSPHPPRISRCAIWWVLRRGI
jgi:hypothetical protein